MTHCLLLALCVQNLSILGKKYAYIGSSALSDDQILAPPWKPDCLSSTHLSVDDILDNVKNMSEFIIVLFLKIPFFMGNYMLMVILWGK